MDVLMYLVLLVLVFVASGIKIVKQYERKVVFTLGKYAWILYPWLQWIIPLIQVVTTVDIREKAVDVPSQEAMTKDNISCGINVVIYYAIKEAEVDKAVINVKNLDYAMSQFAQTTMRNIVGQFELDELLAKRAEASHQIKKIVDEKSDAWGVNVLSVEIKDITIPDNLKRTIGKQAEAEREKRAKVITSEWELAAAQNLQEAAAMLARTPGAMHLRTLQSINDISSDESNTTVWMLPIEILDAIKWLGDSFKK
jgi:regulator of protease activity HflC (stomatin/prohibitin superfamily)